MATSRTKDAQIPVIDISVPCSEVAQQVLEAASTHGFLFIKNDGAVLPVEDIDSMFDLSSRFFHLPTEHKSTHPIHSPSAGGPNRGWVRMSGEALDPNSTADPKEAFNIAPPQPKLQPLPSPLSEASPAILDFLFKCHQLCVRILTLLGAALEIPEAEGGERWFAERHDESKGPSGSIFRMLYYPKSTSSPGQTTSATRAGAHSDYGTVTLLFRLPGQAGLEILTQDGTWASVPVNPSPGTLASPPILVNIGDLLSFWTMGMLKSTVHRVVGEGKEERFSLAYFCHPEDDVRLVGVPGGVVDAFGNQGKEELEKQRLRLGINGGENAKVLTAKEHLDRRLKVTYGL